MRIFVLTATYELRVSRKNHLRDHPNLMLSKYLMTTYTLHCKDTIPKIRKQIFPEKELCGLSPNFHILVPVSVLYIPTIGLPILLQENMLTDPGII